MYNRNDVNKIQKEILLTTNANTIHRTWWTNIENEDIFNNTIEKYFYLVKSSNIYSLKIMHTIYSLYKYYTNGFGHKS